MVFMKETPTVSENSCRLLQSPMTVKTVNSFQQFIQSVAERHRDDAVPLWKPNWADSMLMHPAFTYS